MNSVRLRDCLTLGFAFGFMIPFNAKSVAFPAKSYWSMYNLVLRNFNLRIKAY